MDKRLSQIQRLASLRREPTLLRQQLLRLNGKDIPAQCPVREDLVARAELLRSDLKLERSFARQLALAQAALELQRELFDHAETCPECQLMALSHEHSKTHTERRNDAST